jgi:predicted DNA-binding transcriptional regulator AlpA
MEDSKLASKAQVALAEKAAKLKAERRKPALSAKLAALNQAHSIKAGLAADSQHQSDRKRAHGARAPPNKDSTNGKKIDLASLRERLTHRCGLLDKHEVLAVVGVTYQTLWFWMRERGTFPRPRIVGGKNKWLAADIADWLAALPPRVYQRPKQKNRGTGIRINVQPPRARAAVSFSQSRATEKGRQASAPALCTDQI